MTRDDILQEVLNLDSKNILLELATGMGKSRLAIEKVKSWKCKTVLLVVNRIVHKQNWLDEFNKWWPNRNITITMTTYVSFPKYIGKYDAVIYDEAHHLSERCREFIGNMNVKHSLLLSATIKRDLKKEFLSLFHNLYIYRKGLRDAIDNDILPDPTIYLIPLDLKTGIFTEEIVKYPKAKGRILTCTYEQRWNFIKQKSNPIKIKCSEKQYIQDLNSQIDWWKNKYLKSRNELYKNKWLRLCSDRLKWLSDKKVPYVKQLLDTFASFRTLVFCNSIEQTYLLGDGCINSKNKASTEILDKFNKGIINHITACNILNEGMNLVNCQVGIYANLNSSDIIIQQRAGRLLRHKNPIIIIPYFKSSREQELLDKMLVNYNPNLIKIITNLNEFKL